jgi:phosphohistidine phosphatase
LKELLLLRHAKSSWDDPDGADHDRPLNKRGARDAPRMGRLLQDEGIVPRRILSSSALRARDTAERVATSCGTPPEIVVDPRLYEAAPADHLTVLAEQDDALESILVVGHNPALEQLLELLTGDEEALPTASLARIELPLERWSQLDTSTRGRLVRLWRPKEL